MKIIVAYFFVFILLVFGSVGYAQENNCEAALEKFRVVFGNGIRTTVESALVAKEELKLALGTTYADQEITYDVAYNHTSGWVGDFLQSLDQNLVQYDRQILLWLNNIADPLVPDWYVKMVEKLYQLEYQINASELTDHVQKYREGILQGQKVLVVSHSQGNFYVNQAKQILASQQPVVPMESFGIFGVATPANNVGGSGSPYITNHRDIILKVPGALPANWTLHYIDGKIADDMEGIEAHGFTDAYLHPMCDVRPALISGIKQALSGLQDPPEVFGSGPITVTMTWDLGNNDVDLHVFEPDNTHVYYEAKAGTSGYLDVDNVEGFGRPEHYYTDCNQLQVGKYTVGVNYYDDHNDEDDSKPARPVTVTVTISVPGASRTFPVTLNDDIQSSGNSSPMILAVITIERISDPADPNKNGKLKYKIDVVVNT